MEEKVLAIVGMGKGISYAVAEKFAKEGFTVAMISRNEDSLRSFQAQLTQAGHQAAIFPADAGDEASLNAAFFKMRDTVGAADVLFYNAAALRKEVPSHLKAAELMSDFSVSVAGALIAAQAVLPAMRARKKGAILFTGGGLAIKPYKDYASLAIGKAGIRSLAFTLAQELKPEGIRVGTVTVCGFVSAEDPKYNPPAIAEEFWKLYSRPKQQEVEIVY